MDYPKFKVFVRCFTFNQSRYIEESMNGFTIQQTNFPFLCCIVDDASNDGEPQVIINYIRENFDVTDTAVAYQRETDYANVVYAQHKVNKNCFFVALLLKENHYQTGRDRLKFEYIREWCDNAEYIAICEGDDYWSDTLKLRKEVDVMDTDEQIGLCYTRAKKFNQSSGTFDSELCGLEYKGFLQMLHENPVVTLTTMYRVGLRDEYIRDVNPYTKSWKMGDYPFWLWIAAHYKVHYLNDVTGVYRVLLNSASHSDDKMIYISFILSSCDIQLFFAQKYSPDSIGKISNNRNYYNSLLLAGQKKYFQSAKVFIRVNNKRIVDYIRWFKYLLCS